MEASSWATGLHTRWGNNAASFVAPSSTLGERTGILCCHEPTTGAAALSPAGISSPDAAALLGPKQLPSPKSCAAAANSAAQGRSRGGQAAGPTRPIPSWCDNVAVCVRLHAPPATARWPNRLSVPQALP